MDWPNATRKFEMDAWSTSFAGRCSRLPTWLLWAALDHVRRSHCCLPIRRLIDGATPAKRGTEDKQSTALPTLGAAWAAPQGNDNGYMAVSHSTPS